MVDLLEVTMSSREAQSVLALPAGWSKGDLKSAFKSAALTHHPDRGGNVEQMAKVNAAYKVLQRITPANDKATSKADAARDHERRKAVVVSSVNNLFDPQKYAEYFYKMTNKVFTSKVEDRFSGTYDNYFYKDVEWKSSDGETVFSLRLMVNLYDVKEVKSLGGSGGEPALAFSMYVEPTVLHDNRKSKMRKKNWDFSSKASTLVDPTKVFPKASIKRMMKGNDKKRKFSKRDMLVSLEKKLKAKISYSGKDVWAAIPMGDYTVHLYRMTFMGSAAWSSHSVSLKTGKWSKDTFKSKKLAMVGETEKLVVLLHGIQRKKWSDGQTLADVVAKQMSALKEGVEKEDSMSVIDKMESLIEVRKKSDARLHYDKVMARGKRTHFDKSEYPPIRGMEGPYRYKSGHILYYDNREGKYYDSKKDMYLSDKEAAKMTM
jgi:hypothetical protein